MMASYRRLEHDLYWGQRLLLLQLQHGACGFRGNAKGQGFRAYLEAEHIPPRKAYRLIKRYLRIQGIWDRVRVANGLEVEGRIRDRVSVTNAPEVLELFPPTPQREMVSAPQITTKKSTAQAPATRAALVRKEPDPRHSALREHINKLQRDSGDPEQWDGRSAKALSNWLKANPGVTLEQAALFVENRFASAEPHGAPPWEWIPKLTKYSEGPLDKYGKTWQPDFTKAQQRMLNTRKAIIKGIFGLSEDARSISASGQQGVVIDAQVSCETCGGLGRLHQRANIPGPRLIPCPACSQPPPKAVRGNGAAVA